jgi:hypothetical protein
MKKEKIMNNVNKFMKNVKIYEVGEIYKTLNYVFFE